MKQLDRFSKFEKGVYRVIAYSVIWGPPLLVIFLVDVFFQVFSPFIRYPFWVVLGIVGIILGLAVAGVEGFFKGVRKKLGKKPLRELEAEIADERAETELAAEDRKERWFAERPESRQRYSLYLLQQRQLARLNDIHASMEIIKLLLIGLLAFYVASRIF